MHRLPEAHIAAKRDVVVSGDEKNFSGPRSPVLRDLVVGEICNFREALKRVVELIEREMISEPTIVPSCARPRPRYLAAMSILSKLFGGSSKTAASQPEPETYKGFRIFPDPMKDGSQFRIAARIEKDVDGQTKIHKLVRADTLASHEAASEASVQKAKLMIDQQGDQIF